MIEWLTSEAGMAAIGLVGGWWMRYQTNKRKQEQLNWNRAIEGLSAQNKSHDAAFERTKDGGTWMRRAIFFTIAMFFFAIIIAGFANVPVVHEITGEKSAFFVLKKTFTEFVTTNGLYVPPEIRKAFTLLVSAYIGQGIK